jgi:hypothetical protein
VKKGEEGGVPRDAVFLGTHKCSCSEDHKQYPLVLPVEERLREQTTDRKAERYSKRVCESKVVPVLN